MAAAVVPLTPEHLESHGSIRDRDNPSPGPGALGDGEVTYDTLTFDDSSCYTGTLRVGMPDGLGTCTWADGNEYDGEWR
eukprot:CAMPEP_0119115256 /NCGR_PEP_ID=MMETSP1180-20130426/50338_1 /TAXON_ID=3052 ORGANISM="Chlamydomonas cf sp, Strain CCMP681" /NCGR_SAMPLE_ID=MMETSP1180 /ASSEMBLY_ACC=CAM_ASM_000741 /LENGTH=78 /DNA_ID=CAMNT_0007104143 /DNA_START=28 /DNA_END=260 /DNA_ORIENTATION=+